MGNYINSLAKELLQNTNITKVDLIEDKIRIYINNPEVIEFINGFMDNLGITKDKYLIFSNRIL